MKTSLMPTGSRVLCAALLVLSSARAADELLPGAASEPLISLHLVDTDVRDALRLVSLQSGVGIVLSNAVSGTVTLELDRKTLAETLDAIVGVTGLEYSMTDSVISVSTLDELLDAQHTRDELAASGEGWAASGPPEASEMRLFRLNYVDAERVRAMIAPLLSEFGRVSLLQTPDQLAKANAGNTGASGIMAELQIGGRLSTSSQGQPAKSHTLVIADAPDRLDAIAEIIREVDVEPMQILIEARFVEVALGKEDKLGIDWNMAFAANGGSAPHTFPFGSRTLGSYNPNVSGGAANGVFPNAPADVSTPGVPGLFTFGTLDFTAFSAVLQMIRDDSRVQVVSNPRVLVRDRTTATILVGERFPILSTTVTDQGTVTEELDRYEPIGVQLEVTPSVLDDQRVELIVRPSTSTLGLLVQGSTGIEVARINTRQIDTSVMALDRQTVVLGGLISTRASEVESRVPFLSDIPLLGWLFTSQSTELEKIDLVVFLTITIMKDGGLTKGEQSLFDNTSFGHMGNAGDEQADWWSELDYTPSDAQY